MHSFLAHQILHFILKISYKLFGKVIMMYLILADNKIIIIFIQQGFEEKHFPDNDMLRLSFY